MQTTIQKVVRNDECLIALFWEDLTPMSNIMGRFVRNLILIKVAGKFRDEIAVQ